MRNRILKLTYALSLILLSSFCYTARAATLTVDSSTSSWTGSITFHTNQDVNLATTPLYFDVSSGVKLTSAWGIANSAITQTGNTVKVITYKWWPTTDGYITSANKKETLSFSASAESYTISNVKLGSAAPIANDDTATAYAGKALTVNVLSNDTCSNGSLTISSVTTPTSGTAAISRSSIIYTPKSGFTGTATFNYTVKDSAKLTATAKVTVTVKANDVTRPVVSFTYPTNGLTISQHVLSPIAITVTANDDSGSVNCVITVDGKIFNGSSASWTPSAFSTYTITAKATDPSGNNSSASINVTISKNAQPVADSGQVYYHLAFPVVAGNDSMKLNDNYKDLIMSNFVAGAMLGHLISNDAIYKNLKYNRDYLYGSLFSQLLQEDIDASSYVNTTDWITPSETYRNILLAAGQGGPYQINDYSKALENGYGLINYGVMQKSLGYSVNDQGSVQTLKPGPAMLDNKYFGPLAATYFHYNDLGRLYTINKDTWGPSHAYFDTCMNNLSATSSSKSFLDMILNATYNAGPWANITEVYIKIGANLNNSAYANQVASINNYSMNDGTYSTTMGLSGMSGTTYILYPRQVRFYLDELYNKTTLSNSSYSFQLSQLEYVFSKCMNTLAYVNSSNKYVYISINDANIAFDSALASKGLSANTYLNMSIDSERSQIFDLLDAAINKLASNLKIDFGKVVTSDLSTGN